MHENADVCSCLPLSTKFTDPPLSTESVLLLKEFDDTPVTRYLIASEVEKCPDLKCWNYTFWRVFQKRIPENLVPFPQVKNELSVEKGIILRGSRVFMPPKFRNFVKDELHLAHQGLSAIKAIVCLCAWWPGIAIDLETKMKGCATCQQNASAPPFKQVSWAVTEKPLDCIHIDHAGPLKTHTIDNHWCRDEMVRSCTSSKHFILC